MAPDEDHGTPTRRLARALRQSKIHVAVHRRLGFPELYKHLAAGKPVICTVKTKFDYMHWVVLYGVGKKPKRIYVAGNGLPYISKNRYSWAEFRSIRDPQADYLICTGK